MTKHKHLDLDARATIELELGKNRSFQSISLLLGKDNTTISKEIRRHISHTAPALMENLSMTVFTVKTEPVPSDMFVPDVLLPKDYAGLAANVWKPALLTNNISATNFPNHLMSVMLVLTVQNVPWKRLFIMLLMHKNNTIF